MVQVLKSQSITGVIGFFLGAGAMYLSTELFLKPIIETRTIREEVKNHLNGDDESWFLSDLFEKNLSVDSLREIQQRKNEDFVVYDLRVGFKSSKSHIHSGRGTPNSVRP